VLEETDKLNSIIEDLLLLSRIDAQGKSIAMRDVELDGVVMEAYEEALVIAGGKKLNISIAALDEATVRGEAGLLKRVFVNLIHNAVKYTPQGGSVELKLVAGGEDGIGAATFIIKDTGIGISRRHLPNIFNRFYRVSASRSPQTGGKGLGLTIVKRILELHGAAIAVDSRPGSGTAFTVVFRKN
jgi:two-component system phosphate regulon sensor histidine kinase PhoR